MSPLQAARCAKRYNYYTNPLWYIEEKIRKALIIFKLNGSKFKNLNEFYESIGQLLVENNDWGKNWNALNDILYGGFLKTDCEEEFKLIWLNSEYSKAKLTEFQDIVELISEHKHIILELK
ncbi:barstar family protein [Ulvibacter litoralis]|uniref:Barstar (Barnase inhibitor) n=1 Tax=Ulvibacter litoralis TaxID=227084 RepID=A0A1G7JM09_9FLAO|nr:barstar family protein [Ulvibacter litoralis]GHC65479.1 hypothetical protein GCM10008083_33360 [Ulvibacter litoralis]SDF25988.1 Barstar (barnase inhibitor) [Ulvibacter litoralis]